jgi:hypothetical protein
MEKVNLCSCGKYPIYNKFHKLCVYCNQKRLDETKTPKYSSIGTSSRTTARNQAKQTIKEEMLRQSGGICSGCGNQRSFLTLSHTIPISLRKDLELEPGNLMLECMACHTVWEHGSVDQKKKLLNYEFKIDYIIKTDPHYYERKFNH